MFKDPSVKAAAVVLLACFATCAHRAHAGQVVTDETFVSGTSFENFEAGWFNPTLTDEGAESGPYHWAASATPDAESTNFVEQVVAYQAGEAYDYAAKGLSRSAYLDSVEPTVSRYLQINSQETLHRGIFANVMYSSTNDFTNLVVRTGARESIYCDLLTRFFPDDERRSDFPDARLIVWLCATTTNQVEELVATNLMVTAGFFTNSFRQAVWRDYRLDTSAVCPDGFDLTRWYRLTIRNHGDISANGRTGLAGFSIYLDGQPVPAVADDYEIWDAATANPSWLSPEARALWRARRLFPSLATPGTDAAQTMSGLTFAGAALVDDLTFTSSDSDSAPAFGRPDTVFTLNWDGGVTALEYTLDGGLTTNAVATASAYAADILLGSAATNGLVLRVTRCVYDEANGYRAGAWVGSNGATLTNGTEFVFDGTTRNPIATVASTRETIDIGPGGFDLFVTAIAALDRSTNAVKRLRLMTNVVVSTAMNKSTRACDYGTVCFTNFDGEYELDLNGHTLRGQSAPAKPGAAKRPTLSVSCKSLRICDTSEPNPVTKLRTGRIQPIGSYTDAEEALNTAVAVYPGMAGGRYVEPLLTVQDGIYDGWVRNTVNFYTNRTGSVAGALAGTVIVDGGRFFSTNAAKFYLESCVTNPALVFACNKEGYWAARTETNMVIWTGLGDGRRWVDPENWRSHRVPAATDVALFPSREEGPWTVDLEDGQLTTKSLILDGDVDLFGTNDFVGVALSADSAGRFGGKATLVFEGSQPGLLTETMLRDDWAGTVLVRDVGTKSPKTLKSIETWGTEHSTVVFNGVRGYVMDKVSHKMTYDLVLRDLIATNANTVTTNYAWKNESGYTGSTLAFEGSLLGDGTFQCGANAKAIYQIIKFANVTNYTGRFDIKGKRVLVGADCELASYAGLIAFGNLAFARTDLGWTCRYATFSDTLYLEGPTNGVLLTATSAEPNVYACDNLYLKCRPEGSYEPGIAWLASTNDPAYAVYVSGEPRSEPDSVAVSLASPLPLFTASGASSYSLAALQAVGRTVAQAAVDNATVTLDVGEETVRVAIAGTTKGLWYGVRTRTSLAADWTEPTEWKQATDSSVTLDCAKQGDGNTCFYSVVVSYEEPATP